MFLGAPGKVFTFETPVFDYEQCVHLFLNERIPYKGLGYFKTNDIKKCYNNDQNRFQW